MQYDKALAKKLVCLVQDETMQLEAARKRLADVEPAWHKLQEEAERLCSLFQASASTYRHAVAEEFWARRSAVIDGRLEEVIAKRDALTGEVIAEIRALEGGLWRRCNCLSGAFGNFISGVVEHLPEQSKLAEELRTARKTCEASLDMELILATVLSVAEQVESMENVYAPLLRLDLALRQALEA